VGLPASGKTTFYRERFAATHVHVSKDLLPRRADKERRQREQVRAALGGGRDLVVDNVNATVEARAWLIAEAHAHGARVVGYVFETTPADCLERNRERIGAARVPAVAIHAAAKRLQPPRAEEGFDALFRVRLRAHNGEGFDLEPMGVLPVAREGGEA
jgi:predicted kinase